MDTVHLLDGTTFITWVTQRMDLPHGSFAQAMWEGVTYVVKMVGYCEWRELDEKPFAQVGQESMTDG